MGSLYELIMYIKDLFNNIEFLDFNPLQQGLYRMDQRQLNVPKLGILLDLIYIVHNLHRLYNIVCLEPDLLIKVPNVKGQLFD